MALKVRRSAQADADIDEVWFQIADDNVAAADRWLHQLLGVEDRLADFPALGPARPEFGENLRSWPFGAYLIFYRVEPGAIDIVRVLHGARDLPSEFQAP